MEEIFATKIKINDVLNIKDFEIPLSETERRHLIITGKNGSGKTTVLKNIKHYFDLILQDTLISRTYINDLIYVEKRKNELDGWSKLDNPNLYNDTKEEIKYIEHGLKDFSRAILHLNKFSLIRDNSNIIDNFRKGEYILVLFEAKRHSELIAPSGIKKFDIKPFYEIDDKAGKDFIQHIVNLKADESFAHRENELEEAESMDEWFKTFEEKILDIFDIKGAELKFDRKNYNFNIIEPGKEPYNLNQLSDGYSSILNIVSELIMRMEEHKTKSYDVQGIVLIDEIETHLHIDLQKKILPFLTSFFPKIQFIVTTHSPFVISSIENAVVCDLEKKIVFDKLSGSLEGWSVEEVVKDILGVKETRNEYYLELLEDFNKALDNENFDEAQNKYELLDKILHPESSLRKVLRIQLTGLVNHD